MIQFLPVLLLVFLNSSDAEIPEIVNDGSEGEDFEESHGVEIFDVAFMLTRRFRMVAGPLHNPEMWRINYSKS